MKKENIKIILFQPKIQEVEGLRDIMRDRGHEIECNFNNEELIKLQVIRNKKLQNIKK